MKNNQRMLNALKELLRASKERDGFYAAQIEAIKVIKIAEDKCSEIPKSTEINRFIPQ